MKRILLFLSFISFQNCMAASDRDSQQYDQLAEKQHAACLRYLAKFDLSRPEYNTIVDLGCGPARVIKGIAEQHPQKQLIGVDFNKNVIKVARNVCKDQQNITLITDAAQTYDLKAHNLSLANLVLCYHMMHWVDRAQLPTVFENIAKNLEPHGILDVHTPSKSPACAITQATENTLLLHSSWRDYISTFLPNAMAMDSKVTFLTIEELTKLAINAGLHVNVCERIEECFSFDSQEEFASFLHTCLQYYGMDEMKKEIQPKFVNDVVKTYREKYNPSKDPQKIEYHFFSLHLTAHKD